MSMNLEEVWRRFWTRVNKNGPTFRDLSPCWIWLGYKDEDGYGRTNSSQLGSRRAHRAAYLNLVGPVPDGLELDHLCHNRACCNPDHLRPVTHLENVQADGSLCVTQHSLKTHCKNGHPFTPENTIHVPARPTHCAQRACRECRKVYDRRLRERKRANASKQSRL
jgi:HNH endonuclease